MNDLNPYQSPKTETAETATPETLAKASYWRRQWMRVRRAITFVIGSLTTACAVFAAIKTVGRENLGGGRWFLCACVVLMFAFGLFILYIAFRGTDKDVRDINWF